MRGTVCGVYLKRLDGAELESNVSLKSVDQSFDVVSLKISISRGKEGVRIGLLMQLLCAVHQSDRFLTGGWFCLR